MNSLVVFNFTIQTWEEVLPNPLLEMLPHLPSSTIYVTKRNNNQKSLKRDRRCKCLSVRRKDEKCQFQIITELFLKEHFLVYPILMGFDLKKRKEDFTFSLLIIYPFV